MQIFVGRFFRKTKKRKVKTNQKESKRVSFKRISLVAIVFALLAQFATTLIVHAVDIGNTDQATKLMALFLNNRAMTTLKEKEEKSGMSLNLGLKKIIQLKSEGTLINPYIKYTAPLVDSKITTVSLNNIGSSEKMPLTEALNTGRIIPQDQLTKDFIQLQIAGNESYTTIMVGGKKYLATPINKTLLADFTNKYFDAKASGDDILQDKSLKMFAEAFGLHSNYTKSDVLEELRGLSGDGNLDPETVYRFMQITLPEKLDARESVRLEAHPRPDLVTGSILKTQLKNMGFTEESLVYEDDQEVIQDRTLMATQAIFANNIIGSYTNKILENRPSDASKYEELTLYTITTDADGNKWTEKIKRYVLKSDLNKKIGGGDPDDMPTFREVLGWASQSNMWNLIQATNASSLTPEDLEVLLVDDIDAPTDTCNIPGVGWILCPITTFISDGAEGLFNYVQDFLEFKTSVLSDLTDSSNPASSAYTKFLGYANIILGVFFLIMIIATLLPSAESSFLVNYNFKKILPNLIIFAILTNISIYICAALVDISNIAGSGIFNIFNNIAKDLPKVSMAGTGTTGSIVLLSGLGATAGIAALASAILSSGALGLVIMAVFAIIAAVFALLMLYLMLAARQAILVILIIIAPLAFACAVLPNTKKWFDKWFNAFMKLLFAYAVIGAVFGGSLLAGRLVGNTLLSSARDDQETQWFFGLIVYAIGFLPIFILPSLIKSSLAAVGKVGATIGGLAGLTQRTVRGQGKQVNSAYQNTEGRKERIDAINRRKTLARAGLNEKGDAAGEYKKSDRWRRFLSRPGSPASARYWANKNQKAGNTDRYANARMRRAYGALADEAKNDQEAVRQNYYENQLSNAGLSNDAWKELAMGEDVTITGKDGSDIVFNGKTYKQAALSGVLMSDDEIRNLVYDAPRDPSNQRYNTALSAFVNKNKDKVPELAPGEMLNKIGKGQSINKQKAFDDLIKGQNFSAAYYASAEGKNQNSINDAVRNSEDSAVHKKFATVIDNIDDDTQLKNKVDSDVLENATELRNKIINGAPIRPDSNTSTGQGEILEVRKTGGSKPLPDQQGDNKKEGDSGSQGGGWDGDY